MEDGKQSDADSSVGIPQGFLPPEELSSMQINKRASPLKLHSMIAANPDLKRHSADNKPLKSSIGGLEPISTKPIKTEIKPIKVEQILKLLDFTNYKLNTVPENLKEYIALTELKLEINQLHTIPKILLELPTLRILKLGQNSIIKIPDNLNGWSNLTELKLNHNSIDIIPNSIGELKNLKKLELQYNKINWVPNELGNLAKLKYLYLSQNQITKLPETIGSLIKLRQLLLEGNTLTSIPNLSKLRHLKLLTLAGNEQINLEDIQNMKVTLPKDIQIDILEINKTTTQSTSRPDRATSFTKKKEPSSIRASFARSYSKKLGKMSKKAGSMDEDYIISNVKKITAPNSDTPPSKRRSILINPAEIDPLPNYDEYSDIEFDDDSNGVTNIVFATISQLIALLTYDSPIDLEIFQKQFICTCTSFIKDEMLIRKLTERFRDSSTTIGKLRVIQVISLWVEIHRLRFLKENALKLQLISLITDWFSETALVNDLLAILGKLNDGIEKAVFNRENGSGQSFRSLKPKEIAKQLCIYNHRLFRDIQLHEFLDGAHLKPSVVDNQPSSITVFSNWFNAESNWVANSILSGKTYQERATIIGIFVSIMSKCILFHNYSSAMAIFSGLNMGAIQRLLFSWTSVTPKIAKLMADAERLFSFKMNFGNYREALKNTSPPCIPVITIISRDITHIEERNSKIVNPETVTKFLQKLNWVRFSGISEHLLFLHELQNYRYDFDVEESSSGILLEVETTTQKTKDQLYELSNRLEPQEVIDKFNEIPMDQRKKKLAQYDGFQVDELTTVNNPLLSIPVSSSTSNKPFESAPMPYPVPGLQRKRSRSEVLGSFDIVLKANQDEDPLLTQNFLPSNSNALPAATSAPSIKTEAAVEPAKRIPSGPMRVNNDVTSLLPRDGKAVASMNKIDLLKNANAITTSRSNDDMKQKFSGKEKLLPRGRKGTAGAVESMIPRSRSQVPSSFNAPASPVIVSPRLLNLQPTMTTLPVVTAAPTVSFETTPPPPAPVPEKLVDKHSLHIDLKPFRRSSQDYTAVKSMESEMLSFRKKMAAAGIISPRSADDKSPSSSHSPSSSSERSGSVEFPDDDFQSIDAICSSPTKPYRASRLTDKKLGSPHSSTLNSIHGSRDSNDDSIRDFPLQVRTRANRSRTNVNISSSSAEVLSPRKESNLAAFHKSTIRAQHSPVVHNLTPEKKMEISFKLPRRSQTELPEPLLVRQASISSSMPSDAVSRRKLLQRSLSCRSAEVYHSSREL